MVKQFLIAFTCLISVGMYAQNSTISPYSYFGIGDSREKGTVDNQMMGGLQLYADSIHLNLKNPASLAKLRLTAYTAGISRKEYRLKDNLEEQRTSVSNLDYLAIAFPVAKNMGASFGLQPYSSVGYNLTQVRRNSEQDSIVNIFNGEGGLNRVFVSFGYMPLKDVAIGATINYNFGTIEYARLQSVEGVQFGTFDNRESRVDGWDFNYSINYTPQIGDKHRLHTYFGANTQVNLVSKNTQRIGSLNLTNGAEVEALDVNLDANGLANGEIKIPTVFTYGLGYGEERKWFVGAEYATQAMSEFENRFIAQQNVGYQDATKIKVGGFFIPNYRALSNVFNRITYRAGLRYEETGLMIENKEINDFGINFGLGVPLGGNFSNLNLGFELGRRGTRAAGLVEESYLNINVGLSLNDRWFIKRKIN
ncbi:hypothetical protein FBT53_12010 [Flavobacterium sp. ASW18X]|nr:hypothetical protein [Flavobacterium sp. ASW18X]TKD60979.1 hypothetical protein FBT53_12010 [Flavobacterium sp. ASW18X]